tara:strand:- start:860 stop:1795 length:936 start_codon:yes stop_codon:yes gene_type:complete
MANGFKVFSVGEVLTAADVNDYLMEQSISIFANSTARDAQITSPIEGQFCYLADSNVLQFYNGSSWANFIGEGDITGVTAGTGLDGGGTSGGVTINFDPNSLSAGTVNVANDSISIIDADDSNNPKKEAIADLVSAIAGTNLTASSGVLNASSGGLSNYDLWQITADATDTGNPTLTANWARPSGLLQGGNLGTGMTQSSGIFTFPSTGYWWVHFQADFVIGSSDRFVETMINSTTDNFSSTDDLIARSAEGNNTGATAGGTASCDVFLDITDVSNHKVKFKLDSVGSGTYANGSTGNTQTFAIFGKMGDT